MGQAIARRLAGFRCQLLHADPVIIDNQHNSRPVGIDDLFTRCDAVVVSAPLTPHTADMVGAEQLSASPPTPCSLNVGRGSVIDEDAVAARPGLRIPGADAPDVFAFEDRARPE